MNPDENHNDQPRPVVEKVDALIRQDDWFFRLLSGIKIPLSTALAVGITLWVFYAKLDNRLRANEEANRELYKDRWTGSMQARWEQQTIRLNHGQWDAADPVQVQKDLQNLVGGGPVNNDP